MKPRGWEIVERVKRGDTLVIYVIGLGVTDPPVATGAGGPAAEPLARVAGVQVMLGGGFQPSVKVDPLYAGLTPNFVGLYQINFTIPADSQTGTVALSLVMDGAVSNTVNIAKGAANPELAHQFINFILDPKIQQTLAERGVDAPVATAVQLTPEQASRWTYGPKMISSLRRTT